MPRYGAKSYAAGQASCKRLANVMQHMASQFPDKSARRGGCLWNG